MITGFDTVTPADIPDGAEMVLLYDHTPHDTFDGATPADWARFPNAHQAHIVTDPHYPGNVYDCETGNGTPADAPGFVQLAEPWLKAHGGGVPCVYCNWSIFPDVKNAMWHAGIGNDRWVAWVAAWVDGGPGHIPAAIWADPLVVGVQYANPQRLPAFLAGRNLDLSVFRSTSWLSQGGPEVLDPFDPVVQALKAADADMQSRIAEIQNSFDGLDPDPLDPTGQTKIGLRFLIFKMAGVVGQLDAEVKTLKAAGGGVAPAAQMTAADRALLVTDLLDGMRAHPSAPVQ